MAQDAFQRTPLGFQFDAFQFGGGVDPAFLTPCTLRALAKLGLTVGLLIFVMVPMG